MRLLPGPARKPMAIVHQQCRSLRGEQPQQLGQRCNRPSAAKTLSVMIAMPTSWYCLTSHAADSGLRCSYSKTCIPADTAALRVSYVHSRPAAANPNRIVAHLAPGDLRAHLAVLQHPVVHQVRLRLALRVPPRTLARYSGACDYPTPGCSRSWATTTADRSPILRGSRRAVPQGQVVAGRERWPLTGERRGPPGLSARIISSLSPDDIAALVSGLGHALTPRGWGRVGRVVEDRACSACSCTWWASSWITGRPRSCVRGVGDDDAGHRGGTCRQPSNGRRLCSEPAGSARPEPP